MPCAGIGAQAKALENIGANFEHYRVCEFDKYAMASYNAIHGTNFETSDIRDIHAQDLGIVDLDKYCYIMTYSFPCQSLSLAGKQEGMSKGSGTRSGLLWEVERLLDECIELPQVLLMENVPQVHGVKNKADFEKWIQKLESLGYSSFYKDLNSKDYGVPQNRNRTFMVSVRDSVYEFPRPFKLTKRLKNYVDDDVDDKYYIPEEKLRRIVKWKSQQQPLEKVNGRNSIVPTLTARGAGEDHSGMITYCDDFENTTDITKLLMENDGVVRCKTKN